MSIFVLKSKGMEPMMIGDLGIKPGEGIYIEVEKENVEKRFRIDKLGGYAVSNEKYMRSNTSGITQGKYFKKIAESLNFEPVQKERLNLLNDENIKFNLSEVIKILEDTDNKSKYFVGFDKVENKKFTMSIRRFLDNDEIVVQEHEFKDFDYNFRDMYEFEIKVTLGYLEFKDVIDIKNIYLKGDVKVDLEFLKEIINQYQLNVADEKDRYIRTHYEKRRTSFNGRHSEGIEVFDKSINKIMTFAEAAEKWDLSDSTLRKLVKRDMLKENVDYRKSGKVWLITEDAMNKIYGENSNK